MLDNIHALQMALDSKNSDPARSQWMGVIQKVAAEVAAMVQQRAEKHPQEWAVEGALPAGCEWRASLSVRVPVGGEVRTTVAQAMVNDVLTRALAGPWQKKLVSEVERALVRTLRRQPTRRTDIYDRFVSLWLEREIKKAAGQRGLMAPEKLRLEVRGRVEV